MRLLHTLFLLVGIQLMINGVFFSSSLLTAVGASLICLFILVASKRPGHHNGNGNGHSHNNLGPTYHQIGSPHGRETYFAPLALISLIAWALAYLFLPVSDVYEKTALVLTGTWLLYILLATFAHGFRLTIKNVLWLLFGCLFLLGAAASIMLWRIPIKDNAIFTWNRISSRISHVGSPYTLSEVTGDARIDTGMILAGITWQWDGTNLQDENTISWDIVDSTGLVDTTSNIPLIGTWDEALTYGELIPYIAQKYKLDASTKPEITFTSIPTTDERYSAFKAAYYNRFFSRTVNPDKQVSCDNYIVFIGLAEAWPVSYTAENVYSVFRNEAERRGLLYGCKKWSYVRRVNLF